MKLMAIDGNSIINRAFYGIRSLSAPDGTPTNAVYGFLTILIKLLEEESPDALCVMFDLPDKTFRHEQYDGYKAHRTGMPDELAVQLPIMKDTLAAMNISYCELAGWEADDLLGTVAAQCENSGWDCVIVTGDKDSLQLVSEKTCVKHVKTRMGQTETKNYTPAVFFDEYGFEPAKIVDLKALMGDSSDNIPGVRGVGEKTALDLIRRFGGVSDIYDGLDNPDIKDSVRKKLESGRQDAVMSFDLALIRRDAPLQMNLQEFLRRDFDNDSLFAIFRKLGFTKLTEKFSLTTPGGSIDTDSPGDPDVVEVKSQTDSESLLDAAKKSDCISVAVDDGFNALAVFVDNTSYIMTRGTTEGYDGVLTEILSGGVKKIGHDVKDIISACLESGHNTDGWIFDTALAAYLISPTDSSYDIGRISRRYTGYSPGEENRQMTLLGDGGDDNPLPKQAFALKLLHSVLSKKLEDTGLVKLFYDVEMPLCRTLAEMEHTGCLVDKAALVRFGEMLGHGIAETEHQVFEMAGETFNVNSPKQLGVILFEKLMLPAPKKTKTGYSTNAEVLEHLLDKHPIIRLIMEYRELAKLKSTYADGLMRVIASDGRIHTRFQMTVTATGRLSSVEPNLQNIPVRREMGGELRKMFIAAPGNVLVDADYSQIELRLLAHIAGDSVMREAFLHGEDIHTVTASQVFGVPPDAVTPLQRSRAKAVNFGIVYGISAFSLARDIDVPVQEAKRYIDAYLDKYAGVRKYMTDVVEKAKQDGYVATLFGRRRNLPELKSPKFSERSFGERVALNMPIQGTAADIMKLAMINVRRRLRAEGLSAKLILQIHDELIVECPEHESGDASRILREEMENCVELSVPLTAETHFGKSWFDAK